MAAARSSYAETRELLRWRVALVLVALMSTLMLALGFLNASLGLADTARLAWIVFALNGLSLLGLIFLPRRVGSVLFFGTILGLVIFAVVFGWWNGRPLHYWGYLFPVVVVFLLPAWRAMVAMLVFGFFTAGVATTQLPSIEVVRFLSVYGLMVCFVTTYALLEERAGRMLRELSDRDGLTHCLNRRRFNEAMARAAQVKTVPQQMGLLLVDIDHFKAINDTLGHLEGDRVLAAVAASLERTLIGVDRDHARIYRYGGEEFAVLLHGRTVEKLRLLAEALRAAVAAGGEGLEPGQISISVGVAGWLQGQEAPEGALQRADNALYEAKRSGRNCVVVAGT